ncbi:YlbL family protein [Micrococcus terreus]|uniref:YlbL family protein n=1 Tax=Micrococcus terreus TaxID=574650 RepID=UPI003D72B931
MPQTGHPPTPSTSVPEDRGPLGTASDQHRPERRLRRLTTATGAVAGLLVLTAVALPTPYIIESPGPTFDTIGEFDGSPVITVDGAQTYPTAGRLDLTTVYVAGAPQGWTTFAEVAQAWVDPDIQLMPQELVYPSGTTSEQVSQQNTQAMATSQSWAVAAALEELEIDYRQELFVSGFTPETQAEDLLQPQDQLISADGVEVTGLQGLKRRLNESGGEPVELGIIRDGREMTVQIPVYPGPGETWLIGVYLDSTFDFPVDVTITLENVGGPSAGMMFALGLVDELTPGPMTGGRHIAGTGTIDPDGTVGPIGGVVQKVAGAREAGAETFLAPAENCAELAGRVPDGMTVYAVSTLGQARQHVEDLGRDREPQDAQQCG